MSRDVLFVCVCACSCAHDYSPTCTVHTSPFLSYAMLSSDLYGTSYHACACSYCYTLSDIYSCHYYCCIPVSGLLLYPELTQILFILIPSLLHFLKFYWVYVCMCLCVYMCVNCGGQREYQIPWSWIDRWS